MEALGRAYLLEVPELTFRQLGGAMRLHAFEDKRLDLTTRKRVRETSNSPAARHCMTIVRTMDV